MRVMGIKSPHAGNDAGVNNGHRFTMIDFGISDKKVEELHKRMAACGLGEEDIEERFIRGSGPGGQKINKTASCVYLKHTPTGLSVKMQKTRVQPLNRFYARRRLCELLEQEVMGKTSPQDLKQEKLRKQKQRRKRRTKKKLEE